VLTAWLQAAVGGRQPIDDMVPGREKEEGLIHEVMKKVQIQSFCRGGGRKRDDRCLGTEALCYGKLERKGGRGKVSSEREKKFWGKKKKERTIVPSRIQYG